MEGVQIDLLRIERSIRLIRGDKVILDEDLAELYGVETKNLIKVVKRNLDRFPADFMFQLTNQEFADLRFQSGTSSQWGGRRTPPYAFSEQGVAMPSSVLHSQRAVREISKSCAPSSGCGKFSLLTPTWLRGWRRWSRSTMPSSVWCSAMEYLADHRREWRL